MTTKITYNPTPDPDNVILRKFLEAEPVVDKFKGNATLEPFWHDGEWVQLYSEDGSVYGGYWDFGGFQCSDDFLKKLEQHPVIRNNVFTCVWIDEASKLSKKQILYLSEKCLEIKLENTDAPKKQHKPRQNIPYWVSDWRNK